MGNPRLTDPICKCENNGAQMPQMPHPTQQHAESFVFSERLRTKREDASGAVKRQGSVTKLTLSKTSQRRRVFDVTQATALVHPRNFRLSPSLRRSASSVLVAPLPPAGSSSGSGSNRHPCTTTPGSLPRLNLRKTIPHWS